MPSGNKGDWSEIYVFFKLLAEGKLHSGDADLNKIEDLFYPIIKILRDEFNGKYEYTINNEIVIVSGGENEIRVPIVKFQEATNLLLQKIKTAKGYFTMDDMEEFMNSIHCYTLKAPSKDKTDIKIIIHDLRTGLQPLLGFSIKSEVGSPSSIVNASKENTGFLYKITGINKETAEQANTFKLFRKKFDFIKERGGSIIFQSPISPLYNSNLIYIDYVLPQILGEMILDYYSSKRTKVADLVSNITSNNPLKFDYSFGQDFYAHKVKRFLTDVILGMKPKKPWRGEYEATGGYIIVKEDGDVICYHIYDKKQFENYLFNNTYLDTPSTTRHEFGDIYEKDGDFFISLNLLVRFS